MHQSSDSSLPREDAENPCLLVLGSSEVENFNGRLTGGDATSSYSASKEI